MSVNKEELKSYIANTKLLILATTSGEKEEVYPSLRTIGSFAADGFTIYFSTGKDTAKVKQLEKNPGVTAFFQQDGQEPAKFRNVTVIGKAKRLDDEDAFNKAVDIISKQKPRLKERIEKGEKDQIVIYKIKPEVVKTLDFSRGPGPKAVETIEIKACSCACKAA